MPQNTLTREGCLLGTDFQNSLNAIRKILTKKSLCQIFSCLRGQQKTGNFKNGQNEMAKMENGKKMGKKRALFIFQI
jgi:hypothetical protein